MKKINEFPFDKARRITPKEVRKFKKAIEKITGQKRKSRPGRPPKSKNEKYVAVSIRLNPNVLRWTKSQAKKKQIGYQTFINDLLEDQMG